MRTVFAAVLSLVSLAALADPTLVLVNGNVFTNDPAKPSAQAIAITGSQITAVGTNAEIKALVLDEKKTVVRDLQGRMVIPGLNDAHVHPNSGSPAFGLAIEPDATWAQVAAALSGAIEEMPKELWIRGTLGPGLINDSSITRE